jgi:hypothetical protein
VLSREMCQLPLRRRDRLGPATPATHADEAIARLPPMDGVVLDVCRALA